MTPVWQAIGNAMIMQGTNLGVGPTPSIPISTTANMLQSLASTIQSGKDTMYQNGASYIPIKSLYLSKTIPVTEVNYALVETQDKLGFDDLSNK